MLIPLGFGVFVLGIYLQGWVGGVHYGQTGRRYYISIFGLLGLIGGAGMILLGMR